MISCEFVAICIDGYLKEPMLSFLRKTTFLKTALLATSAIAFTVLAPAALHADSITYNITLTPNQTSTIGGTGTITLQSAPASSGVSDFTLGNGLLDNLSFAIGGQTFSLADATAPSSVLVRFVNGSLNDITYAAALGTNPNRFALLSSGGYVFDYNNLASQSIGSFTATLAPAPVPEPGSLLLLCTGLLGGAGTLSRRLALRRAS
jgi:hypothetical protein